MFTSPVVQCARLIPGGIERGLQEAPFAFGIAGRLLRDIRRYVSESDQRADRESCSCADPADYVIRNGSGRQIRRQSWRQSRLRCVFRVATTGFEEAGEFRERL